MGRIPTSYAPALAPTDASEVDVGYVPRAGWLRAPLGCFQERITARSGGARVTQQASPAEGPHQSACPEEAGTVVRRTSPPMPA